VGLMPTTYSSSSHPDSVSYGGCWHQLVQRLAFLYEVLTHCEFSAKLIRKYKPHGVDQGRHLRPHNAMPRRSPVVWRGIILGK
jgi:hypothetical protein